MDDSYNEFDKHIKAKLENFDVTGAPEGWDALEGMIEADPDLSADPFDEMIKSKLEGNNVQYEPGLWSLMESRIEQDEELTASEINDMELDGMLYEALNNYKVAYNPNHWDLMLQRIKEEFSIQHHLYKYKVAEVSLMILAILTLLQFYPGQSETQNRAHSNVAKAEIVNANRSDEIATDSKNLNSIIGKTNTNNNNTTTISPELSLDDHADSSHSINNQPPNNPLASAKNTSNSSSSDNVVAKNGLPPLIKETHGIATVSEEEIKAIEQKADALQQADETAQQALLLNDSAFDLLALESAMLDLFPKEENNNLPDWKPYQSRTGWAFKLGMLASLDFNLVMTPYDEYFSSASYDQLASGYTGGLSFSIHRKRWAIATGAMYSSKSYETKENTELKGNLRDGYIAESLEAAQLNILSIPLNLTYTFDNSGKWQWYALTGVSAKLATINNFDHKKEKIGGGSRNNGDPRIPPPTLPHQEKENEYLGALEGGDFKNNLFFTANIGFGMERYVTPRWSVFIQPTYQHSFYKEGLTPNNDRIHTVSLFLGTRATLK